MARELDRRRRQIDAGDDRAMPCETNQVGAGTAPDLQHAPPAELVEGHQPRQVMQFLEMILLEIGEEAGEPGGCVGDVEIVNVRVPVRANGALGR